MKNIKDPDIRKEIKNKLIRQLCVCSIPTIIGFVLSSSTVKRSLLYVLPDWLGNILVIWWVQFLIIIVAGLFVPMSIIYINEVSGYYKKKAGYEILLSLISHIDAVVEKKRLRFKGIKENSPKSDSAVFRKITKPDEQISVLCSSLCSMMRFLTNNNNVKSSLFLCRNGIINSVLAVCGEDEIKSSIEELNKNSLAKKALDEGRYILVEDTDNDESFYKPKGCNAKSAVVFPIFDGGRILFVLCFTSSQKNIFLLSDVRNYNAIIDEFKYRILLEWHLYELLHRNK